MIFLGLEEFSAKRKKAQTDIEDSIRQAVEDAVDLGLDTSGWRELLAAVRDEFEAAYEAEFGESHGPDQRWLDRIEKTLKKTKARNEHSVERITVWLATAILSQATIQASHDDPEELFLEWVDMGDSHVRTTHKAASGQVRPTGEKFTVGGEQMEGPGDPSVDIELWINCRCTLRPVLASEALTAATGVEMTDTAVEPEAPPTEEDKVVEVVQVPWHGVLAPEGVPSGDGRMFAENSLRNRDLPLPLTWQKSSADGHSGSVTVAKIEKLERRDSLIRASGYFLTTPEADEVMGLMAEFGKFGVSVDADDAEFELDEEKEMVVFTSARIASASIVAIPAFAEAYVSLGRWDDEDETPPSEEPVEAEPVSAQSLTAAKTEDGPGWLTHPVDTDRLRDYWVSGPGAAKIGWGTPGDFNRCRMQTAKYVKPQYLNGYCANRHYDALGFWPGRPTAGDAERFAADILEVTETEPADALSIVASGVIKAPAHWFTNPNLTEPTPVTVTDEGRVFGHIATWGTCHIGFGKYCQTAPKSKTNYAYFLNGLVSLDNGESVPVGHLTLGGGHADGRLGLRAAVEHYDSTSSVVCDVTVGQDDVGIWFSGWKRPGVSDEMLTALQASPLSGDWRDPGTGHMELVAALAVNTPGFLVPRVKVAASSQGQVSLVAAGAVAPVAPKDEEQRLDMEALAELVAQKISEQSARKAEMARLRAIFNGEAH